jgi:hypothetical protein
MISKNEIGTVGRLVALRSTVQRSQMKGWKDRGERIRVSIVEKGIRRMWSRERSLSKVGRERTIGE